MKKTILCYGDSNTHGYVPVAGTRYSPEERWTGILQKLLGDSYTIIEEGLNSRTIDIEDDTRPGRNGDTYLLPCICSQAPIDLIILMLGTNDMKHEYNKSASDIAYSAGKLAEKALEISQERNANGKPAKILLISPLLIPQEMDESEFKDQFSVIPGESYNKSRELAPLYQKEAEKLGIFFVDGATCSEVSLEDCLHMNAKGHKKFALALKEVILQILE